ncbi:alpha/beta fold hydrolase [Tychonema sp. LEGE 06208]|uniref:alpha/beta fold hydrolase n=1 Tax=Tychonema sp. LEGE 06208 TaxID=1828663 RepID=UPI00187E26DF|nr:alpha/beta hydrolase [Tychonema sp. LEGE 06208]
MSYLPQVLCLSASPHLQAFDRPLLQSLAQHIPIASWEYQQTPDEPCSLDIALVSLHDYLKHRHQPIHLIGHGISGLLALLYAQRHPERVLALTLLSVGAYPAVDWQAHYYAQRQLLPCSRQSLLTRMVDLLFGCSPQAMTAALVKILEQDLDDSLSPHSLVKCLSLAPIRVTVPLLVCGGVDDVVVDPHQLRSWRSKYDRELEATSRLWVCPGGRYFFHFFYPKQTAEAILDFWQALPSTHNNCLSKNLFSASNS